MTITERNTRLVEFFGRCNQILQKKGGDYNPSGIAFDDLEEAAKDLGIKKSGVLWIYMGKHISAIRSYIRYNKMHSENIGGRLMDLANYCAMMAVLLKTERRAIR